MKTDHQEVKKIRSMFKRFYGSILWERDVFALYYPFGSLKVKAFPSRCLAAKLNSHRKRFGVFSPTSQMTF